MEYTLKLKEAMVAQNGLDQDRIQTLTTQINRLKESLVRLEQEANSELMKSSQIRSALVIFKTKEMAHKVYEHWNPNLSMTVFGGHPNPQILSNLNQFRFSWHSK